MTDEDAVLYSAVRQYGDGRYRAGVEAGLQVAERIAGWLTRKPDTRRQAETRKWALAAIKDARWWETP